MSQANQSVADLRHTPAAASVLVVPIDTDLDRYIESAVADATHAFNFLKESGTLSASLIFNISHRIPGHHKLLSLRFPQPWERD